MTEHIATRSAGKMAMTSFAASMGTRYETGRNYDCGPGRHNDVSMLSPYIRCRLITEREVIMAALAAHGPDDASKFIEEVIWRGYYKGWLERRPNVWHSYVTGRNTDLVALKRDRRLRRDLELAETGNTGLACFDSWAQELVGTGYLHNHARMWFASIWIFTLELPWRLGADFFYRHLLDGDAAANTLNWRWAAGLHTRGKPYPARHDNIATFTNGRFTPTRAELATVTRGLEASEPDGLPTVQAMRDIQSVKSNVPTALLVTVEDCLVEDFDTAGMDICSTATLATSHLRSPRPVSGAVSRFENMALQDAAARLGKTTDTLCATDPAGLVAWAAAAKAKQIFTPYVTHGPLRDWLDAAQPILAAHGITLCEQRRDWDMLIWPHATAGFFKVRKQIPHILKQTMDYAQI
ncbi:FAD-binding domain-containing protein [Sulfitobacter guttiformis]|uniref:DNA photolyase-like FAD binding protein n=1 Tax=Sulfitobacter guttiformis TaxID=74349 RepID=A0A420DNX3_9RHOB|nr:FAD-binding domain-containing protein [Sulfitobacter guttiformis]KIN73314.1 Deoxyribodipyrimidine photo-lyase family protein [Sulfitobacter guttiformis KCTC 32187]RKE95984.1 DNA photolyase-like FAD binding protein [Sulfitobacter guttiformis]